MKHRIIIKKLLITSAILLCIAIMAAAELLPLRGGGQEQDLLRGIATRMAGGLCFVLIARVMGYRLFCRQRLSAVTLLFLFVCLSVSVNNFPFIAAFTGKAHITAPPNIVRLFAVQCLSVGFFEESAFRAVVFLAVMSQRPRTTPALLKAVLVTNALFGAVHMFNLLAGAGIAQTLLQAGYSFLTGCMWSVVFLATRNLLYCVVLHAVYNFGGLLYGVAGTVYGLWDIVTVTITVLLALLAALIAARVFSKYNPQNLDGFYRRN